MPHKIIINSRQGILGFYMPRPMATGDFREACSLWLDEIKGVAELTDEQVNGIFNHSQDGRPRNALSPYRFSTDGNWGLLHAVGETATGIVRRVANVAVKNERLPAVLAAPRWEDRNVGIVSAPTPVLYEIPEMIVCRDATQHKLWARASRAQKLQHVQQLVRRGLARQLEMLGCDLDLAQPVVVRCERERAVPKLRRTSANAFVRVAAVAFELPVVLHGHWAAGALINRGFGAIHQASVHE
ncbi:hypothetical protein [Paracidovorax wautersii]|uniref:Uncharacterized protein n=1 Tax=Paracidovorax wautersii TaxID=1177982 RepID=A0A1I2HQK9_9BURK|nr:hypothetical protein [Paracidovorax wautersii]SFF31107.1 hypothetical protein SAMN04489711_1263 [Paracidovorax wautersii]